MNKNVVIAVVAVVLMTAGAGFGQQMMYMYPGMSPGGYAVRPTAYGMVLTQGVQAPAMPGVQPGAVAPIPQPAPQGDCPTCGDDVCKPTCAKCCFCEWQVFGEGLYIRPRNVDIAYATPFDGPITSRAVPLQVGRTGIVDADYEPAFRVGFGYSLDKCTTVSVAYTRFESETFDSLSSGTGNVFLMPMVTHPSVLNAATNVTDAWAQHDLQFDLIDLDYRHVFLQGQRYCLNYLVGLRYAHLDQNFRSQFEGEIRDSVNTDINFDGVGLRFGLEMERHAECTGAFVYGKTAASVVGGEFRANYFQGSDQDPVIVDSSWKAGRLVSMLDLEVGMGWTNCDGRLRLSAGYMVSGWFNVAKTANYIRGVQANDYHALDSASDNTMSFDGLITRVEVRW
jgi:hypothetical protein